MPWEPLGSPRYRTFDDGPKPYVLTRTRSGKRVSSQSLLGLLDQQGVEATFFVMGLRLSKNADEKCRQVDGGVCREAAEEGYRRGDEIENHTYGHGNFRVMVGCYGEPPNSCRPIVLLHLV